MAVWSTPARRRLGVCCGVLLALASLRAARNQASAPPAPVVEAGTAVDSSVLRERAQCLTALGVDRWHHLGYRGQGCTIAILDSGFRGYRSFLGKGLPASVVARTFRKDGAIEARDSQHGVLCAEVIHALAPEAKLLLASWEPDDPNSFLGAVRWAKACGARVLSCSLIMPNWSDGEGGGQVHEALQRLLGSGRDTRDLICFASAGNTALRHWTGAFNPNRLGLHQWRPERTANTLTPWGTDRVAVELYGPTKSPCELVVTDAATGKLIGKVAFQTDVVENWGQAVVRFDPEPGHEYAVRLRCTSASKETTQPDRFHLVALGGNLEEYTSGGSIPFPGDGAGVVAVGAVDAAGQRLSYISCGPNSRQPKPDFVGLVPFPSLCRDRPFAGTSAAAPEAAALAALFLSRYPDWSPLRIRAALERAALDLSAPGHDWETGYGLIRLP